MRVIPLLVTLASVGVPTLASARPVQASAAGATVGYSVAATDLGVLLDNPQTKAVLDKYIPQMVNSEQIAMARSMTLKSLQQYAGETLTDDTLAKIDTDLGKVPAK